MHARPCSPSTLAVRFLLAALMALSMSATLVAQIDLRAVEGKTVSRIDFVGLRTLKEESIEALMLTKVGEPFREANLDRDIKTLGQEVLSTIPSVSVEFDAASGGVVVTISGGENAQVTGVVFLGILEFDRDELLPKIRTRRGALVDDFVLEVDRSELERHYQRAGFHYVDVRFQKQRVRGGDLIVFKITEGPEVTVREVIFEGNNAFTKSELLDQTPFSKEPGFLGISKEEFIYEEVHKDAVALTRFYLDQGFRDARVTLIEIRPTPDHEEMDLVYRVEEGKPYLVRSIAIEGMKIIDEAEVLSTLRTRIGDRYMPGFALRRDISAIEDRYHQRGYVEARVDDASAFSLDDNVVDVILRVTEGEIVYTGKIEVQGDVETQDRVLRREVELYTGEPLNLEKLDRARRRIRSLNYWQLTPPRLETGDPTYSVDQLEVPGGSRVETQDIAFERYQVFRDSYVTLRDTPRRNVKDVIISVQEQDTGSLRFAAGVGSNSGFIGDITYTKQNFDPLDFPESFDDILDAFTGAGQFLTLSFQPGTELTRWRAAWGDPRVFDSYYSFSTEVFSTAWRREDWREDRLGWSVRLGRPIADDLTVTLSISDTVVDINDVNDDAPQLVFDFEGKNRVTSASLEARLDRRDYRIGSDGGFFDPVGGYEARLTYTHGGLWGDIEFDKLLVEGEHYFELDVDDQERPHVLRVKGAVGWASERGSTRDIPTFERFFAGGAGTMRGFAFRGVGPHDRGDPIGGKALWLSSLEYSFPLIENQFRGVAFLDTGAVGLDWGDRDIGRVRASVGLGIRVVIPFLGERPVAIDFGIPLLKQDRDETQLISFSFGSNF